MIDSVPLIQNANDAQQINASIIALKKASRELDEKIAQFNKLLSLEITNREKAITEAINSLDVASVGGSGKYISAISETDGKISATEGDITSTVSSGNSQPVTSGGVASAIAPLQPIDSVTSGSLQPVTSNAVANALNIPRVIRVTTTSSDKIIHLGRFTMTTAKQIGAIVEVETNRADCSSLIIATMGMGGLRLLRMLTSTLNYVSEVFLYKTSDYDYDLYVKACTWATTYIKLTATVHLTYDGSEVTSYRGTQVTPISIIE